MIIYIKPLIILLSFTENKTLTTRHLCNVLLNKTENLLVSNIHIYIYIYITQYVLFYIFSVSPILNLHLTKVIHKIIY